MLRRSGNVELVNSNSHRRCRNYRGVLGVNEHLSTGRNKNIDLLACGHSMGENTHCGRDLLQLRHLLGLDGNEDAREWENISYDEMDGENSQGDRSSRETFVWDTPDHKTQHNAADN